MLSLGGFVSRYVIYVDLGYRGDTNITLVNVSNSRHGVRFSSLKSMEMDDTIEHILNIARKHEIVSEDIYVPASPQIEHMIRSARPSKKQLMNIQKVEND